ncbi:SWI/SNF related-matrix-associated actin-dependent regulator of chromatin subfamily C [Nematocida sp. LUAm3]|nr:SWI/SNF related-matrix-associated actin-dependent regulator of chromatin subfamily C [Nematocida sp. LUAm3]KAI5175639.1 SWI/SNF related-matrix-associated actin-dependent regulator of chromatin subfamily C [Nematocida sp. LUAm2]KAI5178545.1 SWI/SNF related-matrix-associated actin-dependent regulator of chromatin subfamily C [Nematocida sp. LUAm1]
MQDWSCKVDKVTAQSKPYKAGEIEKDKIANITHEAQEEGKNTDEVLKKYPHLFKVVDERETIIALVPMHSSWFNQEKIHEIEGRAFDLVEEEKQKRYMTARNKIFQMYQQSPDIHLTIMQCRKTISEDISEIIKIHSFLEHWGLINYKIGVKRDVASMLEKIKEGDLYSVDTGTANVDKLFEKNKNNSTEMHSDMHSSIDPNANPADAQSALSRGSIEIPPRKQENIRILTVGESNIPLPSSNISMQKQPGNPLTDPSKHFNMQCNGPKLSTLPAQVNCMECSKKMNTFSEEDQIYFSDRDNIILCKTCYDAGKYPSSLTYSSFYLLEAGVIRHIWTQEEEMLLLEGIEMYKDNWKAVAMYVKTKTVEQCVLHFLKMGIQDSLVEMEAISYMEEKIPFNYTLNPVMTTVAFLASVVHPGVASAAAKAAAEEIQRLTDEKQEDTKEAPWLNTRLNEIASVALSSCISRAQEQKVLEEGKRERLLELLVESAMKRIEVKVEEFNGLNRTLRKEREDLEKMRETYRKAHLEARKEISEIVSKVRRVCEETGQCFEDIFFKE